MLLGWGVPGAASIAPCSLLMHHALTDGLSADVVGFLSSQEARASAARRDEFAAVLRQDVAPGHLICAAREHPFWVLDGETLARSANARAWSQKRKWPVGCPTFARKT